MWAAVDGDLGGHIRREVAKIGLIAFDKMWDNGFRQITTSNKPINEPNDLKGLKLRVPVSPLFTSMFRALGTAPTSDCAAADRAGAAAAPSPCARGRSGAAPVQSQ